MNYKNENYVVRFAPSPTGNIHIGNFRILLYNYLFSKKNNCKFILRFEETDIQRNLGESFQNILTIIGLFEFCFDEIVYQSKYFKKSLEYCNFLLFNNKAYYCICSNRENCNCIKEKYNYGTVYFKSKKNSLLDCVDDFAYSFDDLIFGKINILSKDTYDLAIVRSNGIPLYNFINVVSDIEDNITHVIRGADHLSNTWKQVALYKALNKNIPNFIHIPLIKTENGRKVSKREKSNNTVILDLIKDGILTDAIINYCLILGVSRENLDFIDSTQFINFCNFKDMKKSNFCHDYKKLINLNLKHINYKNIDNLKTDLIKYLLFKDEKKIFFTDIKQELIYRSSTLEQLLQETSMLCKDYIYNFKIDNIDLDQEIILEIENLILNNNLNIDYINNYISIKCCNNNKNNYKYLFHSHLRLILIGEKNGLNIELILKYLDNIEINFRFKKFKDFINKLN